MTFDTDWILGTHGNQKNEDDRSKIVIGYHEIIKLNLAAIDESYALYQKFEVNLSSPGRGLVDIYSAESEGMMNKSLQQGAATGTGYMPQGTERGELSIITEQRFVRRICLNNRVIPMEVDLSSLVSVVTDNRLENNRILEVVRRTEIKALGHEHSTDSACDIKKLNEIHQERRPNPNITSLSDDPRRGGRREQLEVPAPDKDNKGKPPMESSETMSTNLSKMQGEEETNESDSEFQRV